MTSTVSVQLLDTSVGTPVGYLHAFQQPAKSVTYHQSHACCAKQAARASIPCIHDMPYIRMDESKLAQTDHAVDKQVLVCQMQATLYIQHIDISTCAGPWAGQYWLLPLVLLQQCES